MSDWTAGYMVDIAYTHGYYSQVNPPHARFALLQSEIALPYNGTCCEFGFRQGVSINEHAAAGAA